MYVDRRLAGIQAVQTLSRLNRAHPGKDTTYVLDFVNSSEEVLAAFKTYFETAELEGVTDPNLIFDLRAKLDASGHYDAFEVDRVAAVLMNPRATQGELVAAMQPVADRLLKRYAAAKATWAAAAERTQEHKEAKTAKDEMDALVLFKADMEGFVRVYTFLSQIFDYANTDIEKRFLFYKHLVRLLEFGRERETVDLSQLVLTHHTLKNLGRQPFVLAEGEHPKIAPVGDVGSGAVQDKQKALLAEIIARVNDLFSRRSDRWRPARLCKRGDQGQAAGVRGFDHPSLQQHQGPVRRLTNARRRPPRRDHGRVRRSSDHEPPGPGLGTHPRRFEVDPARASAAL